jgi:hypothetical protein
MIVRNQQIVGFQCLNVPLNSFFDVDNGFFSGFPLAYAAGQAGTLDDPITIFPWIKNDLAHGIPSSWPDIDILAYNHIKK